MPPGMERRPLFPSRSRTRSGSDGGLLSEITSSITRRFSSSAASTIDYRYGDVEEMPSLISTRYESLDYETVENELYTKDETERWSKRGYHWKISIMRWIVMFFIGVLTALVAFAIDTGVANLSRAKFATVSYYIKRAVDNGGLPIPLLIWVAFGAAFVFVAAMLVAYLEPVAAGSGIPQIKCYLNGIKIPRVVRIQTLFSKAVGVMFSVASGLAVGKEGPMIHSGSVIAAGISQGSSKSFNFDCHLFEYFRHDHEKRDFVSGGAAAGVAAAFGAPVGGVLFSLEEGASFWNQALTWRVLFSAMISTFTLNFILSAWHGHFGELSYTGLINFGQFSGKPYNWYELPIFCAMGAFGGLLGALFNAINYRITIFRIKYVYRPFVKVLEALVVATTSVTFCFVLTYLIRSCSADPSIQEAESDSDPLQMFCNDGEYNLMSTLTFVTPETAVKGLFHAPAGTYSMLTLVMFAIFYWIMACWTYGVSVPSGLFIPSLLIGAAWGRLVGKILASIAGSSTTAAVTWVDPGKYALMGAAANLGGVVRMTISLTVILMEATGNVTYGLPLMLVLMTAKWVGDLFNEGIYDMHIHIQSVPILAWEPPVGAHKIKANEVMNHPVVSFKPVESVETIYRVLSDTRHCHNGFPVISNEGGSISGSLRGLVLRDHLLILLQKKAFFEHTDTIFETKLKVKDLRDVYPRFPSIDEIELSETEKSYRIDLRPYMNPAPYCISECASLNKIFSLFRALGLRHLPVINKYNQVVGIVTRKDLARYKTRTSDNITYIAELMYSKT